MNYAARNRTTYPNYKKPKQQGFLIGSLMGFTFAALTQGCTNLPQIDLDHEPTGAGISKPEDSTSFEFAELKPPPDVALIGGVPLNNLSSTRAGNPTPATIPVSDPPTSVEDTAPQINKPNRNDINASRKDSGASSANYKSKKAARKIITPIEKIPEVNINSTESTPAENYNLAGCLRAPPKMTVNDSIHVDFSISGKGADQAKGELQKELQSKGKTTISVIECDTYEIGSTVTVELKGAGFDIEQLGEKEQTVSPEKSTVWAWSVKPKREGKQVLSAVISSKDQTGKRIQKYETNEIVVTATEMTYGKRISVFLSDWKDFWLVIFLPLVWPLIQKTQPIQNIKNRFYRTTT